MKNTQTQARAKQTTQTIHTTKVCFAHAFTDTK